MLMIGGASGIGLATAHLLSFCGMIVHVLDRGRPVDGTAEKTLKSSEKGTLTFHSCEPTSWALLLETSTRIGPVEIVVANAGISEKCDYFADEFTEIGDLAEPKHSVIHINLKATLNVVRLALKAFRTQWAGQANGGGSLVLTSSATVYSLELSLSVYSATKLAVIKSNYP